jgi:hypothetical protein
LIAVWEDSETVAKDDASGADAPLPVTPPVHFTKGTNPAPGSSIASVEAFRQTMELSFPSDV